jgi:hypothetical protein
MRKYRFGVCPVAGLPLPRGVFSGLSMPLVYVHPEKKSIPPRILEIRVCYGWTSIVNMAIIKGVVSNEPNKKPPRVLKHLRGRQVTRPVRPEYPPDNGILR